MRYFKNPFLYALLITLSIYVPILCFKWLPTSDTLHFLQATYSVINSIISYNDIPLWFPYDNLGMTTQWQLYRIGPSLALLMPVVKLINWVNYVPILYISFLLDEILLLVGSYLLGRAIFNNALTAFFISISLTGSVLWYEQIYFNFHFYYLLPLAFYYIVQGCQENKLWKIFFSANIIVFSLFGNFIYAGTILIWVFIFFLIPTMYAYHFNFREAWSNRGKNDWLFFVFLLLVCSLYLILMAYGVSYVSPVRKNVVNDFMMFLTYANDLPTILLTLPDFFTSMGTYEYNLYTGVLTCGLALAGLIGNPRRGQIPFLSGFIFFFLFSMGQHSIIAPISYYLPFMSFYRHLSYVIVISKIFLVILAGFGLDDLLNAATGKTEGTDIGRLAKINFVLIACFTGIVLLFVVGNLLVLRLHLDVLRTYKIFPRFLVIFAYFGAMLTFWVLAFNRKISAHKVIVVLILIQVLDIYSYKYDKFHGYEYRIQYNSLVKAEEHDWNLNRFRKLTFQDCRIDASRIETSNPPYHNNVQSIAFQYLGVDCCNNKKFHTFLELAEVQELKRIFPEGVASETYRQIIGCGVSKLSLYNYLTIGGDENQVAAILKQSQEGPAPLIASSVKGLEGGPRSKDWRLKNISESSPEIRSGGKGDARMLDGKYQVVDFSDNTLRVKVETPRTPEGGGWLYYADAWHPFWRAYVNGREVPVIRANLAFKAVPVPPGASEVLFVCESAVIKTTVLLIWVTLCGFMVAMFFKLLRLLHPH